MAQRSRARSDDDRHADEIPLTAPEAAGIAREHITELTGQEPAAMTSVELTDEDSWVVAFEIVEDRRIPSSADILGLYEVELDPGGELLALRRTRRYLRGQTLNASNGGEPR